MNLTTPTFVHVSDIMRVSMHGIWYHAVYCASVPPLFIVSYSTHNPFMMTVELIWILNSWQ